MSTPTIVTGDNVLMTVTLKKNGATFSISNTATVKACLVTTTHSKALTIPVTQSKDTVGANWAASLVVVSIPPTATTEVSIFGPALLEIQVEDTTKFTWFVPVEIVQGHIA